MMSQITGNTAGEIEIAATNKGIGDRFGLHNGQYSGAAIQAPG